MPRRSAIDAEVLVIGAGATGLACAAAIARSGHHVVVLEARDRIGGRVWTDRDTAPHPVEFGAEFVHGERASTWPAIRTHGLATALWPKRDESLVHAEPGGPRDGWVGMATLRAADPAFDRTRDLGPETVPARPFEDLDGYLTRVGFDERQRRYVRRSFANASGEAPERLSARSVLAGLADDRDGEQDHRVLGGYDRILEPLAAGLDVRLGQVVRHVGARRGEARVDLAGGQRLRSRAVVVTLPVGVLRSGEVTFDPTLERRKRAALLGLAIGPVIKLVYRLERPPVDDADVAALYAAGPVPMWWSPSAGRIDPAERAAQVWTGFVSGPNAAELLRWSAPETLERALAQLSREVGRPLRPVSARLVDWPGDPYARGGYSAVLAGHDGAREALAEPTPPLFWAGEATAREGAAATVHGAWESGERAADEVLALLA